jgi:hypothetical protein
VTCCAPYSKLRSQKTSATDDQFIDARIADHDAVKVTRCVTITKVAFGAAEVACVLVGVEQQRKSARQLL